MVVELFTRCEFSSKYVQVTIVVYCLQTARGDDQSSLRVEVSILLVKHYTIIIMTRATVVLPGGNNVEPEYLGSQSSSKHYDLLTTFVVNEEPPYTIGKCNTLVATTVTVVFTTQGTYYSSKLNNTKDIICILLYIHSVIRGQNRTKQLGVHSIFQNTTHH